MAQKIMTEIDPEQLAREPIIIEQNGTPVGAVISMDEYRSFSAWKQRVHPPDVFPPAWYEERAAYEKLLPDLLKTHRGKFVAIYRGEVVDADEKDGELISRVHQKLGDEPVYVGEVLESPRVYRIPSVFVKRE